jgi:2'-deoxycytidine 5'-triphosphate deaminase (DCD)
MAYAPSALLFEDPEPAELEPRHGTGLLPAQHLKALIERSREIRAGLPIAADQLQPASLNLRLGARDIACARASCPAPRPRSRTRSTRSPCISSSSTRPGRPEPPTTPRSLHIQCGPTPCETWGQAAYVL